MLKINIKNRLQGTRGFWLTKKWLDEKPFFIFWAQVFKVDYNFNLSKNSAHLLWPTLLSFFFTVLYAVFIIFLFEIYNCLFPVDYVLFDKQVVDTLLSAIASISGVVLGLYFTAVSGIASGSLSKATQNVRRYFLSTPIGEQYVRTVALTGIVSIFYLVAKSFGHPIHPVGLAFLSLAGVYIFFRFWAVGSEIYYALEPTSALPSITKSIFDFLKGVTPPGFKWNNPAIQNHHRVLVSSKLELINDLIDFGLAATKLSNQQLHIALRYLGGLLFVYPTHKRKIPSNSFWYKTKNYLRVGHSLIQHELQWH